MAFSTEELIQIGLVAGIIIVFGYIAFNYLKTKRFLEGKGKTKKEEKKPMSFTKNRKMRNLEKLIPDKKLSNRPILTELKIGNTAELWEPEDSPLNKTEQIIKPKSELKQEPEIKAEVKPKIKKEGLNGIQKIVKKTGKEKSFFEKIKEEIKTKTTPKEKTKIPQKKKLKLIPKIKEETKPEKTPKMKPEIKPIEKPKIKPKEKPEKEKTVFEKIPIKALQNYVSKGKFAVKQKKEVPEKMKKPDAGKELEEKIKKYEERIKAVKEGKTKEELLFETKEEKEKNEQKFVQKILDSEEDELERISKVIEPKTDKEWQEEKKETIKSLKKEFSELDKKEKTNLWKKEEAEQTKEENEKAKKEVKQTKEKAGFQPVKPAEKPKIILKIKKEGLNGIQKIVKKTGKEKSFFEKIKEEIKTKTTPKEKTKIPQKKKLKLIPKIKEETKPEKTPKMKPEIKPIEKPKIKPKEKPEKEKTVFEKIPIKALQNYVSKGKFAVKAKHMEIKDKTKKNEEKTSIHEEMKNLMEERKKEIKEKKRKEEKEKIEIKPKPEKKEKTEGKPVKETAKPPFSEKQIFEKSLNKKFLPSFSEKTKAEQKTETKPEKKPKTEKKKKKGLLARIGIKREKIKLSKEEEDQIQKIMIVLKGKTSEYSKDDMKEAMQNLGYNEKIIEEAIRRVYG